MQNPFTLLASQLDWLRGWLRPGVLIEESRSPDSGDRTLTVSGITRAEVVEALSDSRRAELVHGLKRQANSVSELTLIDNQGRMYRIPVGRNIYWSALSRLNSPAAMLERLPMKSSGGCDRILQEIWENPTPTCLIQVGTGKILLGNANFAEKVGFSNPLEPWGLSVLSTWIPQELQRLQGHLDRLAPGHLLGSQERPYEYRGICLADVVKLMNAGASEAEALATARRVEIGAVCRQVMFGDKRCRVNTTHHFRYA